MTGVAAFLYAALLWTASRLLSSEETTFASRIRNTLVLGIALPGVLGLLHLLYAPLLWIAAVALAAAALRRGGARVAIEVPAYVALALTALVVWPALCRPLLEGDSLTYHLPNAASWVQTHSIWTAYPPYWFYPPGSELFAAGLFEAAGRWALPLAGAAPALLVVARLYETARLNGAPAYAAVALALAFICLPLAGLQAGTLANDLWLAAFFVEILAAQDAGYAIAVCALLKPFGWIEALIAACATRRSWKTIAAAGVPAVAWLARDAVLLHTAASPATSIAYWPTTIAAHAPQSLLQTAHSLLRFAPLSLLWLTALVIGVTHGKTRAAATAGFVATLLFVALPFSYGYASETYLQWGTSLRFLMCSFGAGAVVLAVLAARRPAIVATLCAATAVVGASTIVATFASDRVALAAPIAAAALLCALWFKRARPFAFAAASLAVVTIAAHLAQSRAADFYADWMKDPRGRPTGVFRWIAAHSPPRVVTENLRGGAVIMSSPATWTLSDTAAPDTCALARSYDALLIIGSNESQDEDGGVRARAAAMRCGSAVYSDGAAVVVRPAR